VKTVVFTAPRTVEIVEQERPVPGPDEMLVQVRVSGISVGTEMTEYRGAEMRVVRDDYTYPIYPGYEAVGTVIECGAQVTEFKVADRVLCMAGHSQYAALPPVRAVHLPDNVSDEEATLGALATTCQHAIRRGRIEFGDTVTVIGLGVVGLLAAQEAKLAGAGRVIGVEIDPFRLGVAAKLGIDPLIDARTEDPAERVMAITGFGSDVVFEAVGAPQGIQPALACARFHGRVVILGYHVHPIQFVPGEEFWANELEIYAVRAAGPPPGLPVGYVRWSMEKSLQYSVDLLARGALRVRDMITHCFPYVDAAKVYQMIDQKSESFLQVLFLWD
jgi:2-desacetyl-2-hydroxyethyl bacteriochlorophyllide A dehydrogenase